MTITSWEPRVMAIIDSKPISLFMDINTTFSALLEFWGPTKPSSSSIVEVERTPTQPLMTFFLTKAVTHQPFVSILTMTSSLS
jgi:hypothetical protein